MENVKELEALLNLEQIEVNIFRGQNFMSPWKRVFGGQVLAQSVNAAYRTVPEDRFLHSMHAYFILAGDISMPIVYEVDVVRDGGSFTTRRVVAIQKGRPIFIMAASFQLKQDGFEHQITMPDVTKPENLISDHEIIESIKETFPKAYAAYNHDRPIEFRPVENYGPLLQKNSEPFQHIWFRAKGDVGPKLSKHHEILAYASDYNLLTTATLPHREVLNHEKSFLASLDHAMWIHQEFDISQWHLYSLDSPSASNSRGFTRGNIFSQDGRLVASVVQEGLMRVVK
ncbi:acyl-CoA thioesterase [Portibacter lacus]|uniref:Acyl-CoA thioesterase 2 n=1 Tax=Portibacter lacus TaxID=1099794 RepID=A0AA37SNW3_9BACT|nr:acyl-CoA thioesterase II [Portibacter lacus]GLR17125.1 acyl-CoA thioesterase II [Portibacter lacus]